MAYEGGDSGSSTGWREPQASLGVTACLDYSGEDVPNQSSQAKLFGSARQREACLSAEVSPNTELSALGLSDGLCRAADTDPDDRPRESPSLGRLNQAPASVAFRRQSATSALGGLHPAGGVPALTAAGGPVSTSVSPDNSIGPGLETAVSSGNPSSTSSYRSSDTRSSGGGCQREARVAQPLLATSTHPPSCSVSTINPSSTSATSISLSVPAAPAAPEPSSVAVPKGPTAKQSPPVPARPSPKEAASPAPTPVPGLVRKHQSSECGDGGAPAGAPSLSSSHSLSSDNVSQLCLSGAGGAALPTAHQAMSSSITNSATGGSSVGVAGALQPLPVPSTMGRLSNSTASAAALTSCHGSGAAVLGSCLPPPGFNPATSTSSTGTLNRPSQYPALAKGSGAVSSAAMPGFPVAREHPHTAGSEQRLTSAPWIVPPAPPPSSAEPANASPTTLLPASGLIGTRADEPTCDDNGPTRGVLPCWSRATWLSNAAAIGAATVRSDSLGGRAVGLIAAALRPFLPVPLVVGAFTLLAIGFLGYGYGGASGRDAASLMPGIQVVFITSWLQCCWATLARQSVGGGATAPATAGRRTLVRLAQLAAAVLGLLMLMPWGGAYGRGLLAVAIDEEDGAVDWAGLAGLLGRYFWWRPGHWGSVAAGDAHDVGAGERTRFESIEGAQLHRATARLQASLAAVLGLWLLQVAATRFTPPNTSSTTISFSAADGSSGSMPTYTSSLASQKSHLDLPGLDHRPVPERQIPPRHDFHGTTWGLREREEGLTIAAPETDGADKGDDDERGRPGLHGMPGFPVMTQSSSAAAVSGKPSSLLASYHPQPPRACTGCLPGLLLPLVQWLLLAAAFLAQWAAALALMEVWEPAVPRLERLQFAAHGVALLSESPISSLPSFQLYDHPAVASWGAVLLLALAIAAPLPLPYLLQSSSAVAAAAAAANTTATAPRRRLYLSLISCCTLQHTALLLRPAAGASRALGLLLLDLNASKLLLALAVGLLLGSWPAGAFAWQLLQVLTLVYGMGRLYVDGLQVHVLARLAALPHKPRLSGRQVQLSTKHLPPGRVGMAELVSEVCLSPVFSGAGCAGGLEDCGGAHSGLPTARSVLGGGAAGAGLLGGSETSGGRGCAAVAGVGGGWDRSGTTTGCSTGAAVLSPSSSGHSLATMEHHTAGHHVGYDGSGSAGLTGEVAAITGPASGSGSGGGGAPSFRRVPTGPLSPTVCGPSTKPSAASHRHENSSAQHAHTQPTSSSASGSHQGASASAASVTAGSCGVPNGGSNPTSGHAIGTPRGMCMVRGPGSCRQATGAGTTAAHLSHGARACAAKLHLFTIRACRYLLAAARPWSVLVGALCLLAALLWVALIAPPLALLGAGPSDVFEGLLQTAPGSVYVLALLGATAAALLLAASGLVWCCASGELKRRWWMDPVERRRLQCLAWSSAPPLAVVAISALSWAMGDFMNGAAYFVAEALRLAAVWPLVWLQEPWLLAGAAGVGGCVQHSGCGITCCVLRWCGLRPGGGGGLCGGILGAAGLARGGGLSARCDVVEREGDVGLPGMTRGSSGRARGGYSLLQVEVN